MRTGGKLLLVALAVVAAGLLIGFYISDLTTLQGSASYTVPVSKSASGQPVVNLKVETVAAVGPKLSPGSPDFVSYLIQNQQGTWMRRTVWNLPAHATVHVTIYNFDSASGLRNPYWARAEGIDGNKITIDGKPGYGGIDANSASHTFAVPAYGLIVALPGVGANSKNQCGYAPCSLSMSHRTVQFTFHTHAPGHFRWQCLVPCAAGWIDGFGGPMQTIGYMDGFLNVT